MYPYPPNDPQTPFDMKSNVLRYLFYQGPTVAVLCLFLLFTIQEKKDNQLQANACNEKLIKLTEQQTLFMEDIRNELRAQNIYVHGKAKK